MVLWKRTKDSGENKSRMKIGLVGLGLIGGCLGLDLRASGHSIYGVARRQETCAQALAAKVVDEASIELASLQACDVVFVCTPIAKIVPMVRQLAQVLPPEAVITDVGSVKGSIVKAATQEWPRFVGGHPMSGKSEAGIEAAERHLFQGNSYVITPLDEANNSAGLKTDEGAIKIIEQLAGELGSVLYHCSPTDHDRAVAWISHLPVMVSANLIRSTVHEPDDTVRQLAQNLASSGFRDTSRVGGGNPELGLMMAQYNRDEILRSLRYYQQGMTTVIEQIEAEDWPSLAATLAETKKARPQFAGT
ncbi:MAG: prephenate/arogenate dehydrogenase [Cyanobacteria bacterium P01_C01_bin.121]